MAEGFEPYHVPQQSRRDKLRVVDAANLHGGCAGLLPLCDPSILTPNSLSCAAGHDYPHPHLAAAKAASAAKESDGANLMRYHPYSYMDLQSSLIPINSPPIHDPYLYAPQNLRDLGHRAAAFEAETASSKPEPLSLSLSNSHTSRRHGRGSTNLPLELNLQRYGGSSAVMFDSVGTGGSTSNDAAAAAARGPSPVGPFTGYATILRGSRFLRPAQQLLEEFCDVGRGVCAEKAANSAPAPFMEPPTAAERLSIDGISDDGDSSCGGERMMKKSRLVSMLDEVYKRYKQYYQQLQAVVASFESVAGIGNAAPYANLALKAMSKHFRCLKSAIMDQLQFTSDQDVQRFGSSADKGIYIEHHQPVWRPQRGLPERAVTVLRAWLFEHFLHPYPTDTDKLMLAKQTGLSRSQVSNWFINARVRLWKPMVEEIHMLETRQDPNAPHRVEEARDPTIRNHQSLPSASSLASENPSTASGQRITHQDAQFKGPRHELHMPMRSEEPINLSYNGLLPSHPHTNPGASAARGSSSSVSLTLGLHQNMGNIALSKPFPNSPSSQPFGLGRQDSNGDSYVMIGGFESQNGHFGRDAIGGQLLHDFVG